MISFNKTLDGNGKFRSVYDLAYDLCTDATCMIVGRGSRSLFLFTIPFLKDMHFFLVFVRVAKAEKKLWIEAIENDYDPDSERSDAIKFEHLYDTNEETFFYADTMNIPTYNRVGNDPDNEVSNQRLYRNIEINTGYRTEERLTASFVEECELVDRWLSEKKDKFKNPESELCQYIDDMFAISNAIVAEAETALIDSKDLKTQDPKLAIEIYQALLYFVSARGIHINWPADYVGCEAHRIVIDWIREEHPEFEKFVDRHDSKS